MTYEDDEQLLEYQTEADDDEFPVIPDPVPVCVKEPVVTVETVPQHVTCYTVVVDTDVDQGVAELLPLDPLRVRATVIVSDQPVIICHTRPQAQDGSNRVASVPNPNGAYIPASPTLSTPVPIHGTQQMWVAGTTTDPARVSVIVERRSA